MAQTLTLQSEIRCNLCHTEIASDQPPRWRKHGLEIFQCRSCSLLFRGSLPTSEQLAALYDRSYFHPDERSPEAEGYADYIGDESEHRFTARRRVRWLGRRGSPRRLLDVGAAAGFFLDEARSAGWDVEGIDISPYLTCWGRDRLGLELHTGLFQEEEYPPASFDVVTMWDYIEHSIDPAADITQAARILRRGGLLMLSTGDAGAVVARISGRRWHLLTPHHHNFFFTAETLSRYLQEHGFEISYLGHPGAYYSLRYLMYKLRTMTPRSRAVHALGEWIATKSVGELSFCVNLGDILTVHARRV
jgi:2-polyprenyl-3-methyl-5-hydroxy-6-metoxy-1,4-benzoquinol methylase